MLSPTEFALCRLPYLRVVLYRTIGRAVVQTAEEAEGQGEALKAEVAALRAQLRQSEDALKASQERYLRLTADFDNFRKRSVSSPHPMQCAAHAAHASDVYNVRLTLAHILLQLGTAQLRVGCTFLRATRQAMLSCMQAGVQSLHKAPCQWDCDNGMPSFGHACSFSQQVGGWCGRCDGSAALPLPPISGCLVGWQSHAQAVMCR